MSTVTDQTSQQPSGPTPAMDAEHTHVRPKVGLKTPVVYALAAVASLLLLLGVEAGQRTTFQLGTASDFITIPNIGVPSMVTIVVLAVIMAAAAVWAFLQVRQRVPAPAWLHALVGLAFVLAFLTFAGAGKSSVVPMVSLLQGAVMLSVPLVFGALSGVVCERSGIINIAIEGQLLFGAFAAAVVASAVGSGYAGLIAAPTVGRYLPV